MFVVFVNPAFGYRWSRISLQPPAVIAPLPCTICGPQPPYASSSCRPVPMQLPGTLLKPSISQSQARTAICTRTTCGSELHGLLLLRPLLWITAAFLAGSPVQTKLLHLPVQVASRSIFACSVDTDHSRPSIVGCIMPCNASLTPSAGDSDAMTFTIHEICSRRA